MDSRPPLRRLLPLTLLASLAIAAPAQADIAVTPDREVDYGEQGVTTVSLPRTFTVTNGDDVLPVTINGETFTGTNGGDFMVSSSTCGGSLGPNSSCEILVRFVPSALDERTATMNVIVGGAPADDTASLKGTGTAL